MTAPACDCPLRQAVILVGAFAGDPGALPPPDPLERCGNRPFLSWIMRELCRFGIEQTVLLLASGTKPVEEAIPAILAGMPKPMEVIYIRQERPTGSGGALLQARDHLAPKFLLLRAHRWLDHNLSQLFAEAAADQQEVFARCLVRPLQQADAVICVLARAVLEHIGPACSLTRDVLPALAAEGRLKAAPADGWFIDLAVPADVERARLELPQRLTRRALFLDRDGVINLDHGWVGTLERFEFTPTAVAAIRSASDAGWQVFVVTNQSGIARGHYTEAQFLELWDWMRRFVCAAGGTLDDVRYCPNHPDATIERYRADSSWRKPAPGMLLDLIEKWQLDPSRCHMIGDRDTDLQAAAAAGVPATLYSGVDLDACVREILGTDSGASP